MEQRTDVGDALGHDAQLFVELAPERVLEPLARVDVASGQRDGSRSESSSRLALLGQHVAVPDEHEHDAVERLSVFTPRSSRAHWATPARSARATAEARPTMPGRPSGTSEA